MRAGVELAVRRSKLGRELPAARDAAVNALKGGGSPEHKCIAAVVGGYLWQGASSASSFIGALRHRGHNVPTICQNVGIRVLTGANASKCTAGRYYERAACAAAEGLRNNDDPVKRVLLPNAGDGKSTRNVDSLYYSYALYLVTAHRKSVVGTASFYPDAGAPTSFSR